jgi:acyl-CoA synthetase (AMP-forming)/AMP-acid ligase II
VLAALAALPPGRIALTETGTLSGRDGRRVTAGALRAHVLALAAGLTEAGLVAGDRVLFAVPPGIEAVALILAIVAAGGVVVAADPAMGDDVFRSRMELVAPRWVIAPSIALTLTRRDAVRRLAGRAGLALPPLAQVGGATFVRVGPPLPGSAALDARALTRRGRAAPAREAGRPAAPHAPAFMAFTSGTTGAPRVVVHTQASLAASLDVLAAAAGLRPHDVAYSRDLHLLLPALLAGGSGVIPRHEGYRPSGARRALGDLRRHGVTVLALTPGALQALAGAARRAGTTLAPSVRHVLLGAAPVSPEALRRTRDVLPSHATVTCVYAMTELLPVAYVSPEEKLAHTGPGDLVGRTFPGVEARLAPDGELVLRGPHQCAGYLGEPPLTEIATGDLARLDDRGRLVLLGRKKDMIIRRDKNIYPALYEPTIERIPGVARCALVGVYGDRLADEQVVLVLEAEEPRADPAALAGRVRAALRHGPGRIDADALPDAVVVAPLPLVGRSRKVDRAALRALARERLAGPPPAGRGSEG